MVHVRNYQRSDGTNVTQHSRSNPMLDEKLTDKKEIEKKLFEVAKESTKKTLDELKVGDIAYGKGLLSSPDTPYHRKMGVVERINGNEITIRTTKGHEEIYDRNWLTKKRLS